MASFVGWCLFLLAGAALGGSDAGSISFPAVGRLPEERPADLEARFPEGVGAVQSIANVVLKVLDHEAVRTSPKNWVVSPLSLAAVIAQLLLGSRGYLQSTLIDSLSLEKGLKPHSKLEVHKQLGGLMKYLERSQNGSYNLELNAAVFLQPGIHLKPTYKHALLDFYNAQIYMVDFLRMPSESTQKVNQWVKMATHGKLPALYSHPLPSTTVSLMANAVYFNGRWEDPFDPDFTKSGPFFIGENKKVNVDYMFGEKELLYKNTSEMQLVGIPYKNWEVVLYVLLPHERLATSLSVDHLDRIIASAERENITLSMPKLKLLSTISVRQSVLKYLMNSERLATRTVILSGQSSKTPRGSAATAPTTSHRPSDDSIFEDAGNFDVGGASADPRFKFDDVIHQVSMEVNERGSEIAAATASLVDYSGDNFLLKVDRPFWFFVRHKSSSTQLFWGRIVDPSSDRN